MKFKVIVFRHTQSIDNVSRVFSGRRDVALTPQGIEDARKIAERLRNVEFSLAYTSPLRRCKDTLDIVLEHHKDVEVRVDERIVERSYGWLEGQSKDKWANRAFLIFKVFHRSYRIAPPGGESLRTVQQRVQPFLGDLEQAIRTKRSNVVICAHGNSLRPIRQYFERFPDSHINKIESGVGELFEYDIEV